MNDRDDAFMKDMLEHNSKGVAVEDVDDLIDNQQIEIEAKKNKVNAIDSETKAMFFS
jgi:hypothetical protein